MSKKEKVFSIFGKIALILNTISMVVAIVNLVTSLLSLVPGIGYMAIAVKSSFIPAVGGLFVPGLVFAILGFFGNKSVAKKALTRLILCVVFHVVAVVLTAILIVAFGAISAFFIMILGILSESSSAYLLFI